MQSEQLIQGTPEWHEFRRTKVGASEAPIILGISPYMTAYQLYLSKKGYIEQKQTFAMAKGHEYEKKAIKLYEEKTGHVTFPSVRTHPEYSWMMASFDGLSFTSEQAVEVKYNNKANHMLAKSGLVPDHHYPQLQHQMAVADLDEVDYLSFNEDMHIVTVKRDQDFIDDLILKEKEFIYGVLNDIPPELTEKDKVNFTENIEWLDLENRLEDIKSRMNALKDEEDSIRKKMEDMSEGKGAYGEKFMITYSCRKGNVNYKLIPELSGVDLDKYRGKPTRVVTIKEIKKGEN